eukprot:4148469-Karenia_brevis.AAC.1
MSDGIIVLCNKPGRVKAICDMIQVVLDGRVRGPILMSIRGKAIYAEGQMFGRLSAVSTRLISKWLNGDDSSEMKTNLLWALRDLQCNLVCAPPRTIGGRSTSPPVVIFTDGA